LRSAGSSFSSLEVFQDCSGGNSRPSRLSGVGGGNFLGRNPNLNDEEVTGEE
jgi:hypothetical protein